MAKDDATVPTSDVVGLGPEPVAAIARHLPKDAPPALAASLAKYLDLLYAWNRRMNLTAVRDTQEMIALHLPECLLAAQLLPAGPAVVLDYGSGAGLPGIPAAALRGDLTFTLAESQTKKAGFLREAIRHIPLPNANVWTGRVEAMEPERRFDAVMLRAVDQMAHALQGAAARTKPGAVCLVLTSEKELAAIRGLLPQFAWERISVPESRLRVIFRGTLKA
jgi:16S rRNA (guanine527-N7)-methyltransferase